MKMARSIDVFIVWLRYITLKRFWRTLENDAIKGPFHTFHQIFYKDFVLLVFWNKYYSFVPFSYDWLETLPGVRNLVFLLNLSHATISFYTPWKHQAYFGLMRNYVEICRSYKGFSMTTSKIKYKNCHNFGSSLTLTCGLFFKSYFWKVFHLKWNFIK